MTDDEDILYSRSEAAETIRRTIRTFRGAFLRIRLGIGVVRVVVPTPFGDLRDGFTYVFYYRGRHIDSVRLAIETPPYIRPNDTEIRL